MNKQPTPETDKAERMAYSQEYMVDTEFARKLERERDEAFELLASEKTTRNHIIKRSVEVERERDDAVEEIKEWKTLCLWGGTPEHIHGFIRGQQSRIQQLERERDEAREEANKLSGAYEDATNYYARIIELKEELDEAREALVKILKNE